MGEKVDRGFRKVVSLLAVSLALVLSACQAPPTFSTPEEILSPVPGINSTPLPLVGASSTPDAVPSPSPQATPFPQTLPELARSVYGTRLIESIRIPALSIDAPVTPVGWTAQDPYSLSGVEWDSPEAQVGWLATSALPGDPSGKIILYGHNNIDSSIFKYLYQLAPGDEIELETGEMVWIFVTEQVEITPVEEGSAEALFDPDPGSGALVLVILSCYPPDNNTQRVIVTARPE